MNPKVTFKARGKVIPGEKSAVTEGMKIQEKDAPVNQYN